MKYIVENGNKNRDLAWVNAYGKMVPYMKAIGKTINHVGREEK
jgi:hypothetical protein